MVRERDGGVHDDGVEVQPPDPFRVGVGVEGFDDGGEFGPYGVEVGDGVFGDVDEEVVVPVEVGVFLAVGLDGFEDVGDAVVVALSIGCC